MLKARWRIALKRVEQKTSTLKKTLIAVCVFHNICIQRDGLYGTDNNNSDDSFDDDDGRIRLGVLIFKVTCTNMLYVS